MKRVRMVVAYDGTAYRGWQLQPNGITIEQVLNRELTALLKEPISVIGASRTDSGVHARGNVAVFDTENRMPADKICFALNQRLPEDIRVQSSEEVPADWHPRKANCTKTYEYKVLNRKISMPLERLYAHFCYFNLDLDKMREAAAHLVGEHDFKSFCTVRTQAEETVRTIYSLDITKQDDMITIRISGSGFLYNMVRIIAGTLLEVGMGAYPPEHVEEILDARQQDARHRPEALPWSAWSISRNCLTGITGRTNTGNMTFCSLISNRTRQRILRSRAARMRNWMESCGEISTMHSRTEQTGYM